jgi:hypothetical protein
MKKNYLFLLPFVILFFCMQTLLAQRIKRSAGTAQVRVENNMTKQETRRKAEELAKIDAITKAFGSFIEQESNMTVESGKSRFNIIGNTKVKGEWVETLNLDLKDEPREVEGEYGTELEIWITCNIRGKVKEATPKANIEAYALSCPDKMSKSGTFNSGDALYLYFKSPVDGYLSVYYDDYKDIFQILPYKNMSNESCLPVKADKEYVLFSDNSAHNYYNSNVDQLEVFTPLESEINTLHVIFSEKKYFKPRLNNARHDERNFIIPKSLSRKNFEEWSAGNKTAISDFLDYQINIEIFGE